MTQPEDELKELRILETRAKEFMQTLEAKIKDCEDRHYLLTCRRNNYGQGCGHQQNLSETNYIQTHWYESPYGCTGGDTWHEGEGNWICNECGHRNRLIPSWCKFPNCEDRSIKYKFKSIIEEYND